MSTIYILTTILCATLGGYLAKKLRVPAGGLIGALIFVSILNITTPIVTYPSQMRTLVQILSGVLIGSRFTKNDVLRLKTMGGPAIILSVSLLSLTVIFAFMMTNITQIDLTTAFFSCAPGGVSDLALIAADLGANPEQVALLQLGRFAFVLLFFPTFIKRRYLSKNTEIQKDILATTSNKKQQSRKPVLNILSILLGVFGGFLFKALNIPAGTIFGSIAFTILGNFIITKAFFPNIVKFFIQVLAGCYIGSQINRDAVLSIPELILPLCIVICGILVMAFLSAFIIHKATKLDYITSLFSCIPGGIAEMGIIADDLGLDTPKIIVMHTIRVIAVICFFPILANAVL